MLIALKSGSPNHQFCVSTVTVVVYHTSPLTSNMVSWFSIDQSQPFANNYDRKSPSSTTSSRWASWHKKPRGPVASLAFWPQPLWPLRRPLLYFQVLASIRSSSQVFLCSILKWIIVALLLKKMSKPACYFPVFL